MRCEKCGHVRHEGNAPIMAMGFVILLMALDRLLFKGEISQRAIWLYLVFFVGGFASGAWRDKRANEKENENPEKPREAGEGGPPHEP